MKPLVTLIFAFAATLASADTYSLYAVRVPKNLIGADEEALFSAIHGGAARIETFIQTDSSDAATGGTVQEHTITYPQTWDEHGNPTSKATREVGTRFRVVEDTDIISVEFRETHLEGWISTPPSGENLQPFFSSREINTGVVTLEPGDRLVLSGLTTETFCNGTSQQVDYTIIIERDGEES